VPSAKPFDLYDPAARADEALRKPRVHHPRRRILPHYLRFVRGIVDSADLPLSLSAR